MAKGLCDHYCIGCLYNIITCGGTCSICTYYLDTGNRRPCPAGTGCTVKQTGRRNGAWRHKNDHTWAERMYEAKMAKAVLRKSVCKHCGAEFETVVNTQVYCTKRCRYRAAQRTYLDKQKIKTLEEET